ncbi:MAG: glycogen/starch synthase [Sinomicrobium sp.]|nr:glycogen/starch synthase [Sinomicrobium sp.]
MTDKKVLFVSSEVIPYLPENEISLMSYETMRMVSGRGGQIRIFTPKFGNINERRHQLHEVIRLSGMNLIINDMDMPLIIKVASIPKERIQVYFIDNEDYFKRKATFSDEEGNLFPDNDERAIFFAKGVVETVKKLNWSPDIIHVHGWMTALVPLYLRKYYGDEPLFSESKIITSVYNKEFDGTLSNSIVDKIKFDNIANDDIAILKESSYSNLLKVAINNADAVIVASKEIPEALREYIKTINKPVLPYIESDKFEDVYIRFYDNILNG